jgi:two-component system response regulator GlrR
VDGDVGKKREVDPAGFAPQATEVIGRQRINVRRFRLSAGKRSCESRADRCTIGSHESNDLLLADGAVSRFHCEITIDERGARVRDLGSRNGTMLDGVQVVEGFLRDGSILRLGRSNVRFTLADAKNPLPLSTRDRFGGLLGGSMRMRATFAQLERAATTDFTVLLEGETGTGKEAAADSIHQASARRRGPFVVVDCSALPKDLLESELFGHERGAFTGADARRVGVFEEAAGGTVFLDEIGELPLELQPKLLRVIEQREVRRVGSNTPHSVDVRLIAATNRDLRAETNAGRFRVDLYYRLAVVRVPLPPLRDRSEDIALLVDHFLDAASATQLVRDALTAPAFLEQLAAHSWPGNVRELRNYVQRCAALREALALDADIASRGKRATGGGGSYEDARRSALAEFERKYVMDLLATHETVSAAARAAGIARVYLHRLIRKHGHKHPA